MSQIERRDIAFEQDDELVVESRADGRTVVQGYAVVWNRLSVDLGGFRERILPGAFDKVLNRQRGKTDLVSYYNHDHNFLLGRESAGTLEVYQDDKGLGYRVYPPMSRADVVESIQRRDVKGSSFTFSVNNGGEGFVTDENGRAIREVRDANLYELGPVVNPAYPSTTSQVARRSYELWLAEREEVAKPKKKSLWLPAAMRLRAALLRSRCDECGGTRKDSERGFCPTGPGGGQDNSCGTGKGDGGGATPGGGSGPGGLQPPSGKHNVQLPAKKTSLKIDEAKEALTQMGYKPGPVASKKVGKGYVTVMKVKDSTGHEATVTTDEVKDLVYDNKA